MKRPKRAAIPTGKPKAAPEPRPAATATGVRFNPRAFVVALADGRSVSIPLTFYPTLQCATPAQRRAFVLLGEGRAISWDALDLDLSVEALLAGAREGIPQPPPPIKAQAAR